MPKNTHPVLDCVGSALYHLTSIVYVQGNSLAEPENKGATIRDLERARVYVDKALRVLHE